MATSATTSLVIRMMVPVFALALVAGCGGSKSPSSPSPSVSITCDGKNPCSVAWKAKATIAWTASNTSSCVIKRDGTATGWSGVSGSQQTPELTADTTYSVECSGATASVKVTVPQLGTATVTATDGLTNARVPGVTVTTAAGSWTTDANGQATIDVPSGSSNIALDKSGYMSPYETTFDGSRTTYLLWPVNPPNSDEGIKQMVYSDTSAYNNRGLGPMTRIDGPVSFYFDADLATNPTVVAKFRTAASILEAAIGGKYAIRVSDPVTQPMPNTAGFLIRVDSTLPSSARTSYTITRGRFTSGNITFNGLVNLTSDYYIRHEMGHVIGLWHHEGEGMVGKYINGDYFYTKAEVDNMRMMLRITPGTLYPYNDRTAYTVGSFSGEIVIQCK